VIIAILISFSGVLIISVKGDLASFQFSNPLGSFLALVSSLFWATYWILNMKDPRDPIVKLTLNFLFSLIYIGFVAITFSRFYIPSLYEFGLALYIGLFEMGLTFAAWLKALSLSEHSAKIANFAYLSPFLSLIFIHFIVGEKILISSIAGLGFIIVGIVIQSTGK